MTILNIIIFNILDQNVCSKIIDTREARPTLSNITGSSHILQKIINKFNP